MRNAQVDDKYQYSCDNKDSKVHGWICTDPAVGFWVITPSNEFRSGGPLKQNLTSHVGPTSLAVSSSLHPRLLTVTSPNIQFTMYQLMSMYGKKKFISMSSCIYIYTIYIQLTKTSEFIRYF